MDFIKDISKVNKTDTELLTITINQIQTALTCFLLQNRQVTKKVNVRKTGVDITVPLQHFYHP